MNVIVRTMIAAGGVAALASWIRHAYAGRRANEAEQPDQFAHLYQDEESRIEIDDDTAADIIRRARPALERAKELTS